MRLISHQTFLFRSYLHVISRAITISSAILAHLFEKLSFGSSDPNDVDGRVTYFCMGLIEISLVFWGNLVLSIIEMQRVDENQVGEV